jgi:uncharacterized Zn finger protein
METLRLSCPLCGQDEEYSHARMLKRVQDLGMLRRAGNPEPELLEELFNSSLSRMECGECGATGLVTTEIVESDWGADRRCDICGKLIPDERLEVLPDSRRCVQCEQ